MNSDGDVQLPSNVTRICRCINHEGIDKPTGKSIPQIIYYHSGVGTDSLYSSLVGGATGQGISENIREAYSFICANYADGDEIFLIGFSRGAFTARSVSSLIKTIGLLTPIGLEHFCQIFEDWEFQALKGWKTRFPIDPWENRPSVNSPEYLQKLLELELTRPNIGIKAVAVWDTVGALGIPKLGLFNSATLESSFYSFVDTNVEPNIEYAFQALALDEHRTSFTPTIWEKPPGQELPRVLKQCWFPGVHSDIGGGYPEADLANLTLAWMVSQLDNLLDLNHGSVLRLNRLGMERYEKKGQRIREWGLGKIHNSMTPFFWLGGSTKRTPGEYRETDPKTNKFTNRRLENTNERMHSSVRIRMGQEGLGYNDKGKYDSVALKGWTMHASQEVSSDSPGGLHNPGALVKEKIKDVRWIKKLSNNKQSREIIIPEDELGDLEKEIMELWPEIANRFDAITPGEHSKNLRRSSTLPDDHPHSNRNEGETQVTGFDGQAPEQQKPYRENTI